MQFCSSYYFGDNATLLKGINLLRPLKCALVKLNCMILLLAIKAVKKLEQSTLVRLGNGNITKTFTSSFTSILVFHFYGPTARRPKEIKYVDENQENDSNLPLFFSRTFSKYWPDLEGIQD